MTSSWWTNKLGNSQPHSSGQKPTYVPAPVTPQLPPTQQVLPESPRCPSCGSNNYGGTAETRARCYDCGYPIQQSGSGIPGIRGPKAEGPVQPAKQVHSGNNFNPQQIIGKI